jgi:hypothetical protein
MITGLDVSRSSGAELGAEDSPPGVASVAAPSLPVPSAGTPGLSVVEGPLSLLPGMPAPGR